MLTGKFLLAVIAIAIADSCIQWFFIGFLFHKYQAATPTIWRKESSRSYLFSTVLSFLFALIFSVILSLWMHRYGAVTFVDGIVFGALCWLAFIIPLEVGAAIYVNYSPMFVVGKCLSGLVECIVAAVVAVAIL